MLKLLTYRKLNVLLVMLSALGMIFAVLYLQNIKGLLPCPLCVFQRVGLVAMGVFALIAAIFAPNKIGWRWLLWAGSLLSILWSFGVATRHVWLQSLPADQVPACGPGLDYWLDALPMQQVVHQVLSGSGECATIDWTFLGLSIPVQAMIFFGILILIHVAMVATIKKSSD